MATDVNRLQGEVAENPGTQGAPEEDLTVQKLMIGFLKSLLQEQRPDVAALYVHPKAVEWTGETN